MSDKSSILGLPYIKPSQSQKHVTHNEAVRMLDALVQLSVKARDEGTPPATFAEGDRYIVPNGATDAWAGQDGAVAVAVQDFWVFYTPLSGWQAYVENEAIPVVYDGSSWIQLPKGLDEADLKNVAQVGINAASNATNRLTVASAATLFTHDGDDHRLKINKAANVDTASLLFQSNWIGHAEMGLTGGKNFSVRVSDDGSSFVDALSADAATGIVRFPAGINFGQQTLNGYEQGSWTPRLLFGDDDTGMDYAKQEGLFTRIGNVVVLQCSITLNAKGSGTGDAEIDGLPFAPEPRSYPGQLAFVQGGAGLNAPGCRMIAGDKISLLNSDPTGLIKLTDANFTNSATLKITCVHTI
ncbi:MAG: DUF2793 domain-containing protein [Planctomycetes bacterium]|nr:DUF2793 domain-containing protein [Planctomycetota bacterium]